MRARDLGSGRYGGGRVQEVNLPSLTIFSSYECANCFSLCVFGFHAPITTPAKVTVSTPLFDNSGDSNVTPP